MPYDLVFDVNGTLVRVQVKASWYYERLGNHVVDNRRTKTNRRIMKREAYGPNDFEFALVYLDDQDLFYVFPIDVFIGYGSEIHIVEADKRQRKPQSAQYRDAWELIVQWAAHEVTCVRSPVKVGETAGGATPSQALMETSEKV